MKWHAVPNRFASVRNRGMEADSKHRWELAAAWIAGSVCVLLIALWTRSMFRTDYAIDGSVLVIPYGAPTMLALIPVVRLFLPLASAEAQRGGRPVSAVPEVCEPFLRRVVPSPPFAVPFPARRVIMV